MMLTTVKAKSSIPTAYVKRRFEEEMYGVDSGVIILTAAIYVVLPIAVFIAANWRG